MDALQPHAGVNMDGHAYAIYAFIDTIDPSSFHDWLVSSAAT
jgi:hypothetical protein